MCDVGSQDKAVEEAVLKDKLEGRKGCETRGLSMVWIRDSLINDLDVPEKSTVYQIEDRILAKGEYHVCPRDGRPGAAYVDVADDEYGGKANLMLSYTWGYMICDIVSALRRYCDQHDLSFTDTCVWICCFCVNQHRVKEAAGKQETVSFEDFRRVFSSRVFSAGRVVGLLSPWSNPLYTSRVWCLFETWEATRHPDDVTIDFVLPEDDAKEYVQHLLEKGPRAIFDTLEQIQVQGAGASVEEDKKRILGLIQKEGGYHKLNTAIKRNLQGWFLLAAASSLELAPGNFKPELAVRVAELLTRLQKTGDCADLIPKMIRACPETDYATLSELHLYLGRNLGTAGDQESSGEETEVALELAKKSREGSMPVPLEAEILRTLAANRRKLGDISGAFKYLQDAQGVCRQLKGLKDMESAEAWIVLNMGLVRSLMSDTMVEEMGLTDTAMTFYKKSEFLYSSLNDTKGPAYAWLLRNMGDALLKDDSVDEALEYFKRSEIIFKALAMEDVENFGELMKSMGFLMLKKGNEEDAAWYFNKASDILAQTVSGKESVCLALLKLGTLYNFREDTTSQKLAIDEAHKFKPARVSLDTFGSSPIQRARSPSPFSRNGFGIGEAEPEVTKTKILEMLERYHHLVVDASGKKLVALKIVKRIFQESAKNDQIAAEQWSQLLDAEKLLVVADGAAEALVDVEGFLAWLWPS